MHVAVIGSGPAGIYVADALCRDPDVRVDVFDKLPTPYGLVRYGVAPDHLKIKSIETALHRVLVHPSVRFLGNVCVGVDITAAEMRRCYDGVVYACGAAADRRLDIPGEDLRGSVAATDLVAWYCGHPDATIRDLTLHAHTVVVIGVGNVAVDVTRLLVKPASELRHTDVPHRVLDALERSSVRDVHVVGRRGPASAKFTTKELRELGELANADVVVDERNLVLDPAGQAAYDEDATVRRNVDVLREWATRGLTGRPRRVHLRFNLRPVRIVGDGRVAGIELERTTATEDGRVVGTGNTETLTAQMVVRSVGYRGVPIEGLPFDDAEGTIPNVAGRVVRDGTPTVGEYVAGWIKRGPTGVIGSNRSDAAETVRSLLADSEALTRESDPQSLLDLLETRGVDVVPWRGWLAIDEAEVKFGAAVGRPRVKIDDRQAMLAAAGATDDGRGTRPPHR
jgi:ferredoxin--NADP+ reductase